MSNREIKFRFFRKEPTPKMIYPKKDFYIEATNGNAYGDIPYTENSRELKRLDLIVMQFTGKVLDSKEVYVDDIIELYKHGKLYFTGKVTDHGYHGCTIDSSDDYMEFDLKDYTYRLVGNAHENPELLSPITKEAAQ